MFYFVLFFMACMFFKMRDVVIGANGVVVFHDEGEHKRSLWNQFFVVISLLLISIVAGVRDNLGTDFMSYKSYYNLFELGLENALDRRLEKGFFLINYLTSQVTDSFNGLLFIIAILGYGIMYICILQNQHITFKTYALALYLLILYPMSYNALRQFVSVSILAFAPMFIENRKYGRFICAVILAAMFHSSAVIVGILFLTIKVLEFIWEKFKSTKDRFILGVFAAGSILICIWKFPQIYSLFRIIGMNYANSYVITRTLNSVTKQLFTRLPVLAAMIILRKKLDRLQIPKIYFQIQYMYCVFILLGSYLQFAYRLTYYFVISDLVLIPAILKCFKRRERVLVGGLYLLWYAILFVNAVIISGNDSIYPYTSIIFQR